MMNINNIAEGFYQEQIDNLNSQFHYLAKKFSEDCNVDHNFYHICLEYEKSPMIFSKNGKLHYLLGYRLSSLDQYIMYNDDKCFHYINNLDNYSNNEIIYSSNNLNIGSYIYMVKRHLLKYKLLKIYYFLKNLFKLN